MFLSHFARTPLPRPSTDRPYIATLTVSHENFGVVRVTLTTDSASYVAWGGRAILYSQRRKSLQNGLCYANPISWLPPSPVRQKMPQQAPNEL